MSQRSDIHRLVKALNAVGSTELQAHMAAVLLAVNGLENALAFVAKLPELNRAPEQATGQAA